MGDGDARVKRTWKLAIAIDIRELFTGRLTHDTGVRHEGLSRAFELLTLLPDDFLVDGRGNEPPQQREGW
jgi:hypothetical protein